MGPAPPAGIEQPLNPLLPGGPAQPGASAHLSPHAASAGPKDGARGAMWFAALVFLIVVVCVIGALALFGSAA